MSALSGQKKHVPKAGGETPCVAPATVTSAKALTQTVTRPQESAAARYTHLTTCNQGYKWLPTVVSSVHLYLLIYKTSPFHYFPHRITTIAPKTVTPVTHVTASFLALAHEPVTLRLANARARLVWLGDSATDVITRSLKWLTPAVRVRTYNSSYLRSPACRNLQ